ncbi:histone H3.v1-like [Ixodes scapularis]
MKIQAFPTIAVVAALLSMVCGAPAGNEPNERADERVAEDRSCTKRDADAQNALKNGETVESCNYFCKPYKDGDNYDEKMYPVGTKCKYGDKVSKCTEEGCPYPTDSADDNTEEEKPGEESNDDGENEGEYEEGEEEVETEGDEGGEEEEEEEEE